MLVPTGSGSLSNRIILSLSISWGARWHGSRPGKKIRAPSKIYIWEQEHVLSKMQWSVQRSPNGYSVSNANYGFVEVVRATKRRGNLSVLHACSSTRINWSVLSCRWRYEVFLIKMSVKSYKYIYLNIIQWSGFRVPAGAENFSLQHRVQTGAAAHQASYPMGAKGRFGWG
jgi:hypothetical protein